MYNPVGLFELCWLQLSDTHIWLEKKKKSHTEKCTKTNKQNLYRKVKEQIHSSLWTLSNFLRDSGCIRLFSSRFLRFHPNIDLKGHSFFYRYQKVQYWLSISIWRMSWDAFSLCWKYKWTLPISDCILRKNTFLVLFLFRFYKKKSQFLKRWYHSIAYLKLP